MVELQLTLMEAGSGPKMLHRAKEAEKVKWSEAQFSFAFGVLTISYQAVQSLTGDTQRSCRDLWLMEKPGGWGGINRKFFKIPSFSWALLEPFIAQIKSNHSINYKHKILKFNRVDTKNFSNNLKWNNTPLSKSLLWKVASHTNQLLLCICR